MPFRAAGGRGVQGANGQRNGAVIPSLIPN